MKTYVEFRSDRFPPYPEEDELVNPGIYGKRLAEFLSAGLRSHGIATGEPFTEDWGWIVPIENKAYSLWIGCANYAEYDDGFLCFVQPSKPFVWRWFRKIATAPQVEPLTKAMASLLSSDPAIRDIRWWTEQEFNLPAAEQAKL